MADKVEDMGAILEAGCLWAVSNVKTRPSGNELIVLSLLSADEPVTCTKNAASREISLVLDVFGYLSYRLKVEYAALTAWTPLFRVHSVL